MRPKTAKPRMKSMKAITIRRPMKKDKSGAFFLKRKKGFANFAAKSFILLRFQEHIAGHRAVEIIVIEVAEIPAVVNSVETPLPHKVYHR